MGTSNLAVRDERRLTIDAVFLWKELIRIKLENNSHHVTDVIPTALKNDRRYESLSGAPPPPSRAQPPANPARDTIQFVTAVSERFIMKAMICERFGGPEVLVEREVPDPPPPGPGEIQVRIAARGVQYVDVLMLAGTYQFRPEPPFIPGGEAAGQVVAAGPGVTGFAVGDAVMSRHSLGALGNAKAILCDKVPAGLSLAQAGVFRGAYTTAYHALLQRGRMQPGEWVLIHGAAGGIGIAAIQVAKAFGAKVVATASSEEKRRACLDEGADYAIGYRSGFLDHVKDITGGSGVDIVYDPIGDKVAEESLRCLAWCGRLLILGFLGGGPTNIRSNYLLIKGIDAIGVRIGGLNEANPGLAAANMKALIALAEQGTLRPRISHTFRLDQAREALQVVIDRAVIGKAVLLS
jgi:NADPH:quinone reductase